jgi:hypothetical protein
MATLKKIPTAERLGGLTKETPKKTITDGLGPADLDKFNSRVIPELLIEMKVYCARNKVKIQDFISEAIRDKLKALKK